MKRKSSTYIPDRGDLVWVTLNPIAGHDSQDDVRSRSQSQNDYNRNDRAVRALSGTRQAKGYAFEVVIANPDGTTSVVLADHLRNVDWKARNVQLMHSVSDGELSEVVARIEALLVRPDA